MLYYPACNNSCIQSATAG